MEVWDVQQQFKDLPANRPVRNPRKHTKMVLTLHINTNWEQLIQQLCIDVRCVWYDNLCYFFLFTNNAYVLEQKANDFYPRNDTYLPLVGDVIVVKENSIFVVVVSCCLLYVACTFHITQYNIIFFTYLRSDHYLNFNLYLMWHAWTSIFWYNIYLCTLSGITDNFSMKCTIWNWYFLFEWPLPSLCRRRRRWFMTRSICLRAVFTELKRPKTWTSGRASCATRPLLGRTDSVCSTTWRRCVAKQQIRLNSCQWQNQIKPLNSL